MVPLLARAQRQKHADVHRRVPLNRGGDIPGTFFLAQILRGV